MSKQSSNCPIYTPNDVVFDALMVKSKPQNCGTCERWDSEAERCGYEKKLLEVSAK